MTRTPVDPARALAWLPDAAERRAAAGLQRAAVPMPAGLDLAGNDYLGLSRHPDVVAATAAAARAWGAGSTGSRLVSGTTPLHLELEQALAGHLGAAAALVLSSGYLANLAAVTALSAPGTLVVSDEANHASLVDACRLSRARVVVVPHADPDAVARTLDAREEERALVVTDAVFSTTGRLAPLAALHAVTRAYGALLLVDEAHAVGVVGARGRGAVHAAGLAGQPDVVLTATLSKALGSQGGLVAGPAAVRDHLVSTARSFIFDTALAPPSVGAALAALHLVDEVRVAQLRENTVALAAAVGLPAPDGSVVSVVLGDPQRATAARDACAAAGVVVGCFRPPSVPEGRSCLRLTARADLTAEQIRLAGEAVHRSVRG